MEATAPRREHTRATTCARSRRRCSSTRPGHHHRDAVARRPGARRGPRPDDRRRRLPLRPARPRRPLGAARPHRHGPRRRGHHRGGRPGPGSRRRRPVGRAVLVRPVPPLPQLPARTPVDLHRLPRPRPRPGGRDHPPVATRRHARPRLSLHRDDGDGPGRPRDRGHPDAGRRATRGRGAHRLRRVHGGRRGGQDRRGPGRRHGRRDRPGRRRPVVRDGRGARGGLADHRRGREPGDKIDLAGGLGATHWVHAARRTRQAVVDGIRTAAGNGGPDYVFEAIGLPQTIGQAIAALPPGGTAVPRGPDEVRRDGGLRAVPVRGRRAADHRLQLRLGGGGDRLPAYAGHIPAGRLPVDRLIDRTTGSRISRTPSTGCARGAAPACAR